MFGDLGSGPHLDALLAPLVLDLANADADKKARDLHHPRHFSRGWASSSSLGRLYPAILAAYFTLLASNSAEARRLAEALASVRLHSGKYQCDPNKDKQAPPRGGGRKGQGKGGKAGKK